MINIYNKIIILIFISIFILFSFIKISYAQSNFYKYNSNPLIIPNKINENDYEIITQPFLLNANNTFLLWYSIYDNNTYKIFYSDSVDGLNWQNKNLAYEINERSVHRPVVLHRDNKYLLVYSNSNKKADSDYKIEFAESQDGISFNFNSNYSIKPSLYWENDMLPSFMLYDNDKYYLFYTARNNSIWKLGLATSTDLINWSKCNNPLFENISDMTLIQDENIIHMYYHKVGEWNIITRESLDPISCNMKWGSEYKILLRDNIYDNYGLFAPTITKYNNIKYLIYVGLGNYFSLNLATDKLLSTTTPTPTLHQKYYIIPGLFGSWNKDALLHNKIVSNSAWIMNPITTEYNGIDQTLSNLGYIKGIDYDFYPYDWRKPIEININDLKLFIDNKLSANSSVNLIGHSLGGLISKIFTLKYPLLINKSISIGSPHKGTPIAYKSLISGNIDPNNTLEYIAQKIMIQFNKSNPFQSDKNVLSQSLPILYDMIPIYDFLEKNGKYIPYSQLSITNKYLQEYSIITDNSTQQLFSILGSDLQTINGFKINKQTMFDKLLNIYPDGHINSPIYTLGDGTITTHSASLKQNTILSNYNHSEIISSKLGIQSILDHLSIPYNQNQIIASKSTTIIPSLFIFVKSSAIISVTHNKITYNANDGMIYIPNPKNGIYDLKIQGIKNGIYNISILKFTQNNETWDNIEDIIQSNNPSNYLKIYSLNYSDNVQISLLNSDILIKNLLYKLKSGDFKNTKQIVKMLDMLLNSLNNKYQNNNQNLLIIHKLLIELIKYNDKEKVVILIDEFEKLYSTIVKEQEFKMYTISSKIKMLQDIYNKILKIHNNLKPTKSSLLLQYGLSKLNMIQNNKEIPLQYKYILLKTIEHLIPHINIL